jgi:hypothetical protein
MVYANRHSSSSRLHACGRATDRPRIITPDDRVSSRLADIVPRKEVIQPHLPVRLPCYDFTPVTWPTFDGCPP